MDQIGWIDSHAHLVDDALFPLIDIIMEKMQQANVIGVCSISMNPTEVNKSRAIKASYPFVDIACGIHPADVKESNQIDLDHMANIFKQPDIIAIGEIGLDYYWDKSFNEKQKEYFIKQIHLANQVNKPIIVHMRDAAADTLSILQQHPPIAGGIMHCYSGSKEMAREFNKCNMMISFAGPLTFKNAKTVKEVAETIPIDKLLIETDSPYLTPEPFRGKQNNPSYVQYVGKELSKIKQISEDELKSVLKANYFKCFKK